MTQPVTVTIDHLLERYDALLLDAYGVLVRGDGPMPGAAAFIEDLTAKAYPFFVLTNDASRTPESAAARYASFGLSIPAERIVTSGSLIAPYFQQHRLAGAACAVLGPADTRTYVQRAGGRVVGPDQAFEVLVIGDDSGLDPFLDTVNAALTGILGRLDRGERVDLVLPNPDLIFPAGAHGVGITAGAIAALFEAVLRERYPQRDDLCFARLGKPHAAMFEEGIRRAGSRNVVMIGDQLATDIAGGNASGIDTALFVQGVSGAHIPTNTAVPDYLLHTLNNH